MANLNPESKFSLSLKEVVGGIIGLSSLFGIYFTMQSSIANAQESIEDLVYEELCKRGKAYIAARKRAGEKSSAYLSGRAVKYVRDKLKEQVGKEKII